jgi:hypothetical protein
VAGDGLMASSCGHKTAPTADAMGPGGWRPEVGRCNKVGGEETGGSCAEGRCDKAGRHDGPSGGGPAGDGGVDGRCGTEGGGGVRLK